MADRRTPITRPAPRLERGDDWRDHAACATKDPEMFLPPGASWHRHQAEARAALLVCHGCPVKAQCLKFALDTGDEYAIAGGTTPAMRRQIRTNRKKQAA